MRIIKGDKVRVMKGKDRGREGLVSQVLVKKGRVVIEGVNVYKKHLKARGKTPGGIVDVSRPIYLSNVSLICPKTNKATRVGIKSMGELKVRFCKVSSEVLPSPLQKK